MGKRQTFQFQDLKCDMFDNELYRSLVIAAAKQRGLDVESFLMEAPAPQQTPARKEECSEDAGAPAAWNKITDEEAQRRRDTWQPIVNQIWKAMRLSGQLRPSWKECCKAAARELENDPAEPSYRTVANYTKRPENPTG